jgi:phosphoribosylformylglycinamidine synthase
MKTAIIIFPGSNCDNETERFLYKCTGIAPIRVWHKETILPKVDLYVLPGGFSYGDYLRAGALANLSPIVKELKKTDRKILGICNGFQVLCEAGLLPGTLRINKTEKFICKPVGITTWPIHHKRRIPIAHAEGNYYHPNSSKLAEEQKIAYTYSSYRDDINGSVRGICGVRNNNVLGMMPHPERAFESYHCSQDGFKIMDDLNA